MSDLSTKEGWCKAWGLTGEEADKAWAAKQAFKPQRLTPLIIGDIQPYQAMGADIATGTAPMITSRSQHRDYLRRNGYIEIGNETPHVPKTETITERDVGRDIKKTIEQKGIRL